MNDRSQHSGHAFDADLPLDDPSDDRLGRGPFAQSLAEHLASWTGEESIVIAINGGWGTGKSTVKNFIKHYLRKQPPPPTIVEFNPWEWSAQGKLLEAFLGEIGGALGRKDKSEKYRQIAKKWKRFSSALQLTSAVGEPLKNISKGVFGTSLIASGAAFSATHSIGPWPLALAVVAVVVSGALGFIPGTVKAVVTFFDEQATFYHKPIEELRKDLEDALQRLDAPVVVFLDDIDRLTDEETKMLFQLVKANCRFPNLIYVALFEQEIVEAALSGIVSQGGQRYLRKIVQHPFDLPQPPPARLRGLIEEGLHKALFDSGIGGVRWSTDRWKESFADAFYGWFSSVRDAKRYIGSLKFSLHRHSITGILEVDPIDLVMVEWLRIAHHEIWKKVADGFHARGGPESFMFGKEDMQKSFAAQIEAITGADSLGPEQQQVLRHVLEALLPQASEHVAYFEGTEVTWLKENRLCHQKHFHKYFALALEEDDISAVTLDRVVAAAGKKSELHAILASAIEKGNILDLLQSVFAIKDRIPASDLAEFVTALFDIGDELPDTADGFLLVDAEMVCIRIIHFRLKDETSEFVDDTLLQAYVGTTGVVLPVRYLALEDKDTREKKGEDVTWLISESRLPEFQKAVLKLIHKKAEDDAILGLRKCAAILYRWRRWAGEEEVRAWTSKVIENPAKAVKLLRRLLAMSYSDRGVQDYGLHSKSVETLVDLTALLAAVKAVDDAALDDLDRLAIGLLERAVARKKEGKNYEELWQSER